MSTSTNAILFYGFTSEDEGWRELIEDEKLLEKFEDDDFDLDTYLDEVFKKVKISQRKVSVDFHCSDECRIPFIYINESYESANRGYPNQLDANSLKIDVEWEKQLKDFCEKTGITYKKPGWFLVSYWG